MGDDKRMPPEEPEQRSKLNLHNLFYHNTFVLVFSLVTAVIAWFVLKQYSGESGTYMVYDVPVTVLYSSEADAGGLRVFHSNYETVDVEVDGNSLITTRLTPDDFKATITLNPSSSKVTGNTLQRMSVPVRVAKESAQADYEIVNVNPGEVTVEYDRYLEATFNIEQEITYSAGSGYYAAAPVLSQDTVVISGPESSVNRVARVVVSSTIDEPLTSSETLSCRLRLFDANNQEITADANRLYLSFSVDTVDASISVMSRKTVDLTVNTLRQPENFSSSRITIEPAQIDIAGAKEVLDGISEIQLGTVIDFGTLQVGEENSFVCEIPLPNGVRNLSNVGNTAVEQATVTVNLNGYREATVTVPQENIQITNAPSGREVEVTTQTLEVTLIGPEAQVMNITGDMVSVQADLTNYAQSTGIVEVPVSVTVSGSGADSCWVAGSYTANVNFQGADAALAAARRAPGSDDE